MYNKIIEEIATEYYQTQYPNDGQRFVAWYLRNIHNLEPFEAKDCITDGAGDKQIDAVYIDNQASVIYIIQGKFYSGGVIDSGPLREILSSWIQIQDLAHLQESANERLQVKINELATALEDDYEVCFELITTAGLTDAAQADLEAFQKTLAESETLSANLVLVDNDLLRYRYDEALNKSRPYINHSFTVDPEKYMELTIGGTKAVIAAIPLKECIRIPGIRDGSLFRKNVRQSLGAGNKVNKGIAHTIKTDAKDFFFLHNGITAICSQLSFDGNILKIKELNVVNGCQSLSTIFSCSESVRNAKDAYIMFRFYEISDAARADRISISTNSQSAVKARDLRSNDKAVLAMKKAYEQFYSDGYFITKRGEAPNTSKYNTTHIVNLSELGKQLIAWHSQRPTISYSETKIFDKYFDQLFHKDYSPQKVQALHELFAAVEEKWNKDNPIGLNNTLLAMKAYAPYHHLYTISVIVCELNKMPESVPDPATTYTLLKKSDLLDWVIDMAGNCLNSAFENASAEANESGRIFSPQNWVKAKGSLKDIRSATRNNLNAMKMYPQGKQQLQLLQEKLSMEKELFEARWTAD